MGKIKYLVSALLLVTAIANANLVLEPTAATVAGNYYKQTYHTTSGILTLVYTERSSDGQAVYYVFNVNSNNGFVIVSAEDAGHAIIGSSNKGSYIIPANNCNPSFWMTSRKNEIISIRANNIRATSDISNEWNAYINNIGRSTHRSMSAADSVSPLCTTTWNQSPFYNSMCPDLSVTGCVATAMAQIMRYWAYPSTGTGSNCYDEETGGGYSENYGQLCANFDTSNYVWSAMPDKLATPNKEVAKLMYDCGVSVNMDYSPSGSGAYVMGGYPSAQYSYVNNFGYDGNTLNSAMYDSSEDTAWISLLENELNNKRPMQFQGFDSAGGGHTWVCDGYNPVNEMHMNWGWNGSDDGYYAVTNLNPTPYVWVSGIGVLYGIQPPPGALAIQQVSDKTAITVYPNPSQGIFNFNITGNNSSYIIKIYNVLGQEIYSSLINSGKTEIGLANQSKGIYLYKVLTQSGETISTGKLVVE
jgi:Peptidase C10 family/Spi protease inhibitor/Secretion system C-terminal sorting domain